MTATFSQIQSRQYKKEILKDQSTITKITPKFLS